MLSGLATSVRWNVVHAVPAGRQQLTSELPNGWTSKALFAGVARSHARRSAVGASAAASGDTEARSDRPDRPGGLAQFRELQGDGDGWKSKDLKVPVILFPVEELLLPGRRKRMHLFEPRWVSMVEFSLKRCGGIFGMLYFDDGELFPVLSLVEIMACNNLESQGRIVHVRAVGRGRLKGLTEEVISAMDWGLALAEEDLEEAAAEALQLSNLLEDLDVEATPAEGSEEVPEAEAAEAPQLWTHQRESRSSLGQLSPEKWRKLKTELYEELGGVPMRTSMLSPLTDGMEVRDSLAVLYASLSQVSLRLRKESFVSSEPLAKRLKVMTEKISELQGMARARRALAGVFGNEEK
eukprot:symbB.v1.2.022289.t1/scaffold1969.1/size94314/3